MVGRKLIEKGPWTVLSRHDGADLYGTLAHAELMLRLWNDIDGLISYKGVEELFDSRHMCQRIEDETGLCLDIEDWHRRWQSAVVQQFDIDRIEGSIPAKDEQEARDTLVRAARHWLHELNNMKKTFEDPDCFEEIGYAAEFERVTEALSILDLEERFSMLEGGWR